MDGVRVTTPGTTLTVAAGASVSGNGTPAVTIEVPNNVSSIAETIIVGGQINGGSQAGIALLTGAVAPFFGVTTHLTLTVAQGGGISGTTALSMAQTSGNLSGLLVATIDNAGTITGSSGVALRGDVTTTTNGFTSSYSGFDLITNRASGVITGSITGPVGGLNNAGLIDGGSGSALTPGSAGSSAPYMISSGNWVNSGTIRSNGAAVTLSSAVISTLTNSGVIANAGSGAAISSVFLDILNQTGGQISSAGTTAINGTNHVKLVNAGTITGNVVTGNSGSIVDSSLGTINGSVLFGAGDDTLVVRYGGVPNLITGISGSINAGGGTNMELLAINADTIIGTPVTLLPGFQQLGISIDKGVTATLGNAFVAPGPIQIAGAGTLVNRAAITSAGTAFSLSGVSSPNIETFVNEGSIRTTSSSAFAVVDNSGAFPRIVNNGTIDSAGGGITSFQGSVANSGTITANGTGVSISNNGLTNSGTIRSTSGTGISLSGNVGISSTNSGTIEGATTGAAISTYLTNSGKIVATDTDGVAVRLSAYGALTNLSGGVIGNGGQAITASIFNESVINAGTINGSVSLSSQSGIAANERYISLPGGVLNGSLVLGSSGVLFTDLVNSGAGQFAGINGTVTAASGAQLRYRVSGTQSATIGPVGPFANPSFELVDGASLSLTAPGTVTGPLALAGSGKVDLNANFSATTGNAVTDMGVLGNYAGYGATAGTLTITSRGTIAVTRPLGDTNSATAVSLAQNDSFINLGTIMVTDHNLYSYATGISGAATVTNAGAILLDGGIGIYGTNVINTGTITQAIGGAKATGVATPASLDNRGIISVGGTAVTAHNYNQITNSGLIASTGGVAIGGSDTGASAMIVNAAGGTISATGDTAVQLYSGQFINAGAVIGTVDLGYGYPYYSGAPQRSFASSVYVADGGTITGDLRFGDGPSLLLQVGDSLGVSGTIDGGGGIYGRVLTRSATLSITAPDLHNFGDALVQTVGQDVVATVDASGTFTGNVYAVGNGSVVNQATIGGSLTTTLPSFLSGFSPYTTLFPTDQTLTALTNTGSVAGGIYGTVSQLTNSGSVGGGVYATVSQFTNSGTISLASAISSAPWSFTSTVSLVSTAKMLNVTNTGEISGNGLSANLYPSEGPAATLHFANNGVIASTGAAAGANLGIFNFGGTAGAIMELDNSGSITAQSASSAEAMILNPGTAGIYTLTNSGTIASSQTAGEPGQAIGLYSSGNSYSGIIANAVGGTISATGTQAIAVMVNQGRLNLTNAGTITASGSQSSIAIQVSNGYSSTIVNSGTINGAVLLGDGDDQIILRGGAINGTIDGGGGNDSIAIMGGTATAPITLGNIANVETLRVSAGLATISGTAQFDNVTVSGGRLTGLAGSTITAPTITVGTSATFGSAGTVNGNIAVAGTLSPGASPGTMTVNGNVALAGTSTLLFEITPTVSDKLVVIGALTIANGATLQIEQTGKVRPGTVLDLMTATSGITGSFTNVVQSGGGAFQLLAPQNGSLQAMAIFGSDAGLDRLARGGADYVNGLLLDGRASSSLIAALPQLQLPSGASNAAAFAQITPQAYAAARQISIDNGLTLAEAARGQAFSARPGTSGLVSFGTVLGGTRTLQGNALNGTSRATTNSYGFLGGIGIFNQGWSLSAFGGYLIDHQTLAGIGAQTRADGAVAGLHGRVRYHGIGLKATIAYDGASANTHRALPGGNADGHYGLHGWMADMSIDMLVPLTDGWSARPAIGATAIRTIRDGAVESGGSPFALTVAGRRGTAVFVDGGLTFAETGVSGHAARLRPYLTLGARYQVRGRIPYALAGLDGGGIGLLGDGARRAPLLATATLGANVALTPQLALFGVLSGESGNAERQAAAQGGLRFLF